MNSQFFYSPSSSTNELPSPDPQKSSSSVTQIPQSVNTQNNLILPDSAKNANVDQLIFGSFAGPIPNDNTNNNTNKTININSNDTHPVTLRLILGNRVNIPPAQK